MCLCGSASCCQTLCGLTQSDKQTDKLAVAIVKSHPGLTLPPPTFPRGERLTLCSLHSLPLSLLLIFTSNRHTSSCWTFFCRTLVRFSSLCRSHVKSFPSKESLTFYGFVWYSSALTHTVNLCLSARPQCLILPPSVWWKPWPRIVKVKGPLNNLWSDLMKIRLYF